MSDVRRTEDLTLSGVRISVWRDDVTITDMRDGEMVIVRNADLPALLEVLSEADLNATLARNA